MSQAFFWTYYTIAILLAVRIFFTRRTSLVKIFGLLLVSTAILMIGLTPDDDGSATDKWMYTVLYNSYETEFRDMGWILWCNICHALNVSTNLFFLLTAACYVGGYYVFAKKAVGDEWPYLLLGALTCMGFFSFGVNVIRSGLALSLVLLAMSRNRNTLQAIIFMIIALAIHKSVAIIIIPYIIGHWIKTPKFWIFTWIFILALRVGGFSILGLLPNIATTFSYDAYLGSDLSDVYNVGFRWDFVAYSLFPIIYGCYILYSRHFDEYYTRLFNLYVSVNAVWLFFIEIPYTDRIAFMSWFLIPFIIVYPFLMHRTQSFTDSIRLSGSLLLGGGH